MATPEIEMLAGLVGQFLKRSRLTPDERREVLHIARGLAAREAASIERVPVEVIRARRKVVYRKLGLSGASALISNLLALSLSQLTRPGSS